jgi:hypothetical protein
MMMARRLPVTMGVIFGFAVSAMAADLAKEGAYTGTYSAIGTYKTIKIGDRSLTTADEMGVQVTNGVADHMTFHCWGTSETANGESIDSGYCVASDPSGDLIEGKYANDKHKQGQPFKGSFSMVAGTGKFSGISGTCPNEHHGSEFRPVVEGTYVSYVTFDCHYKLP